MNTATSYTADTTCRTIAQTIAVAISESVERDCRAEIDPLNKEREEQIIAAVIRESDGWATENDDCIDAWGVDEDGNDWRLLVFVG